RCEVELVACAQSVEDLGHAADSGDADATGYEYVVRCANTEREVVGRAGRTHGVALVQAVHEERAAPGVCGLKYCDGDLVSRAAHVGVIEHIIDRRRYG